MMILGFVFGLLFGSLIFLIAEWADLTVIALILLMLILLGTYMANL